ncbi:MAG: hypothetical protein ABUR63_02100 [Verrucomicrobiota bacterium]
MTPVPKDQEANQGDGAGSLAGAWTTPANPPTDWFLPVEETVVLTPPHSVEPRNDLLETTRLPRVVVQGAPVGGQQARRSTPMWAIAAALVLGATVTLSAQAVISRPARPALHSASVNALAAPPEGTGVPPTEVARVETAPALPLPPPVVVANTASLPPEAADVPEASERPSERLSVVRSLRTARHTRVARPRGTATHVSGTRSGAKPATTWVDPFVGKTVARQTGKTRAGGEPAWVDPFAD